MKPLLKHLPWIQLVLLIGGIIFLYGQQIQNIKDIERRTSQCEQSIRTINCASQELVNTLNEIKIDIREIKTELKYLRVGK